MKKEIRIEETFPWIILLLLLASASILILVALRSDNLIREAIVLDQEWITIANPEPVRNDDTTFLFGDSALTKPRSIVKIIKVIDNHYLVRYTTESASGTECPSGAIFFISKEQWSKMVKK